MPGFEQIIRGKKKIKKIHPLKNNQDVFAENVWLACRNTFFVSIIFLSRLAKYLSAF